jgi:hypothetical protein
MTQVADHLSAPQHAEAYAAFRVHVVDALLESDLVVLAKEIDKLHPDDLVATGAATARALTHRTGFEAEVEAVVSVALEATGDKSLRAYLAEAGIAETWREDVEAMLVERSQELVETPAFQAWLEELLR